MPTYFVLKEQEAGRDTYTLVRVASGKPHFVIRTKKYADLLETVIQDATIPLFSVTPRQLIEASFGEPRWKYGSGDDEYRYEFAKRPDYFLKPDFEERKDYEPKPEELKSEGESQTPESAQPDARICPKHNVPKLRNGCRLCRREGTAGTMFEPVCPQRGQKDKSGMKGNPPRQSYKCRECRRENAPQSPQHAADGQPPDCPKHRVAKVRDGHNRGGQRRWRCLVCNPRVRVEAGAGGSSPKGGSTRAASPYITPLSSRKTRNARPAANASARERRTGTPKARRDATGSASTSAPSPATSRRGSSTNSRLRSFYR
jgi:transposase-like protein